MERRDDYVGKASAVRRHNDGSCCKRLQLRSDISGSRKLNNVVTRKFLLQSVPDLQGKGEAKKESRALRLDAQVSTWFLLKTNREELPPGGGIDLSATV